MAAVGFKPASFAEVMKECNRLLDECADLNVLVRSADLQREKVDELSEFLERLRAYKLAAIQAQHEPVANILFHAQCMLRASQASLLVWIDLKKGKHHDAWRRLIDAQEYTDVALLTGAHDGVRNLEAKLLQMREVLFPHFNLYNSPGWIETIGKCSICGAPFAACDHVENCVYMGRLCRRVDRQVLEMLTVSLVQNPRDRRCVIVKRSEGDRMIDYFTLQDAGPKADEGDAQLIEGIVFTPNDLDLD